MSGRMLVAKPRMPSGRVHVRAIATDAFLASPLGGQTAPCEELSITHK